MCTFSIRTLHPCRRWGGGLVQLLQDERQCGESWTAVRGRVLLPPPYNLPSLPFSHLPPFPLFLLVLLHPFSFLSEPGKDSRVYFARFTLYSFLPCCKFLNSNPKYLQLMLQDSGQGIQGPSARWEEESRQPWALAAHPQNPTPFGWRMHLFHLDNIEINR